VSLDGEPPVDLDAYISNLEVQFAGLKEHLDQLHSLQTTVDELHGRLVSHHGAPAVTLPDTSFRVKYVAAADIDLDALIKPDNNDAQTAAELASSSLSARKIVDSHLNAAIAKAKAEVFPHLKVAATMAVASMVQSKTGAVKPATAAAE